MKKKISKKTKKHSGCKTITDEMKEEAVKLMAMFMAQAAANADSFTCPTVWLGEFTTGVMDKAHELFELLTTQSSFSVDSDPRPQKSSKSPPKLSGLPSSSKIH